ncbi:hypothetical protein Lal_00006227 [Lupinus albus]|uniref:Uncharacterized protein n=1 Tax=Lupinus albus TaxID=3870 RepID=A0A6A4QAU1_LUPAL|nr:hypothetical protein Lalb_Chr07g0186671 [Lupinus albus]KAF1875597.1 hypothetical protein Lal_00006227 [Lupinus albus]
MDNGYGISGSGIKKGSSNEDSNRKKLLMSRGMAMENEKEDINKMAETFIKIFHKQLKIEREKSSKGWVI